MEEGWLLPAPIWSDVRTFSGTELVGSVDMVTAGYPCQPFSMAGKLAGKKDKRHLWPHIRRIIEEVRPTFCFLENVENHLRTGFIEVYEQLWAMGYDVEAGIFSAEEIGAPHVRRRMFALAYSDEIRRERVRDAERWGESNRFRLSCVANSYSLNVWDESERWQQEEATKSGADRIWPPGPNEDWSKVEVGLEPAVRRVADGIPHRVDRLSSLGNAVVPLVAAKAFCLLYKEMFRCQSMK
jgi:DNA (cytosine-5)-methyltransferase 1